MRLALTNLDTGQFSRQTDGLPIIVTAQTFPTKEQVSRKAVEQKVKNAAAAMMDGTPQRTAGFIWLTEPSQC